MTKLSVCCFLNHQAGTVNHSLISELSACPLQLQIQQKVGGFLGWLFFPFSLCPLLVLVSTRHTLQWVEFVVDH